MITKEQFLSIKKSSLKNKTLLKNVNALVEYDGKLQLLVSEKDIYEKLKQKIDELSNILETPVGVILYRINEFTKEIEQEFKETFGEGVVIV